MGEQDDGESQILEEEPDETDYGLCFPLSMKGRILAIQITLWSLAILTTGALFMSMTGLGSPESENLSDGVSSVDLSVKLGLMGLLECRYTVMIDTGVANNSYATGGVVSQLWVEGELVEELQRGTWDISNYTASNGSTYTYELSWVTNIAELPSTDAQGVVKIVPIHPEQVLLKIEKETGLVFLGGMKSELVAERIDEESLSVNYTGIVNTSVPDNPYSMSKGKLKLQIEGEEQRYALGVFFWDITGYPVVPGTTYTYTYSKIIALADLPEISDTNTNESIILMTIPDDVRKIELSAETRLSLTGEPPQEPPANGSIVLVGEKKLNLEVEWVFNTSAQFPGISFGVGFQGPPTVWDIDDDGVNELLWGTRRGDSKRLWCIGTWPTPELEWIYPSIDEEGLPGDPTSKVSLVDVDNDGIYELVLAGRGGRLHVLGPDGSAKWTWDEPNKQNMHGAPQALDVDGDDNVEFFLNTNDGRVHRVDFNPATGLALTWTSSQAGAGNQGHPTIVDIDKDGVLEVLVASQDFNLYCFSADTGEEKWGFDTGANMPTNQVIVADVNKDGKYEAIVWTDAPTSAVIVVNFFGREISRWTHPREGVSLRLCQAIGDVDGDGSMDMALMSGDAVFVIDIGAEKPVTKWEANFSQLGVDGVLPQGAIANHWSSYQLIADIDADDRQEILWLAPFPIVTDAATGNIEGYYVNDYIARYRRQENGGWWGDVDGDGISEWVCELNGNSHPETMLYCLTMNGTFPADAYWPEYYHCAYPGEYQAQQDWLLLKGGYSNSLWFPIIETQTDTGT